MSVLVDSHVHVYPHYDGAATLAAFAKRIGESGADCGAMMLVEREGMDQFGRWASDEPPAGWIATPP